MKLAALLFFCCLLGFAQQEQKPETQKTKPAQEQVTKEMLNTSLKSYTEKRWCELWMYYFLYPNKFVKYTERMAPGYKDIDKQIRKYGWFSRVVLRKRNYIPWRPTEAWSQEYSLRFAVAGGCVW